MPTKSRLWGLALLAACCPTAAQADEPKTADEVIAKYVDAIGGRAKLASVQTMRKSGKVGMPDRAARTLTLQYKRPARKLRIDTMVGGAPSVQAYNGDIGWFTMPMRGVVEPAQMSPEQLKAFLSQTDMDGPLVDYAQKGHQVELIGKAQHEEAETYQLEVTKKDETVSQFYIDAKTFLPVKVASSFEVQGSTVEISTLYSDYRDVDGLLIAHTVVQSAGPMGRRTTTFEKIELNPEMPDKMFDMPEFMPRTMPPG